MRRDRGPGSIPVRASPEGEIDALAKWLDLAEEIQTGDERFDSQVFVVAEDDALRRALRTDAEAEDARASGTRRSGSGGLRCNAGLLWVECRPATNTEAEDEPAVEPFAARHVEDLEAIAARLAAAPAPEWDEVRGRAERRESVLYAICIALGVGAFASFLWSEGTGFPRLLSFDRAESIATLLAIAIACALGIAAVIMLSGTPRLHLVLLEIVLAAGPGGFFVARTALAEYGIHGTQRAPRMVVVNVVDREIVRGRRGRRSYYLHLTGWPTPELDGRLKVDANLYDATTRFDCLAVLWSEGRLGDPWIDQRRPWTAARTATRTGRSPDAVTRARVPGP